MSTTAVIAIVIAVVVVLAAVAFFTLARRSDVRGAGALSGETVKRDRDARAAPRWCRSTSAATASDVEAAGTAARTSTARRHHRSRRRGRAVDATGSRGDR